jgi:hypothetical protein
LAEGFREPLSAQLVGEREKAEADSDGFGHVPPAT